MCKYMAAVVALAVGMAGISSAGTYGRGSGTSDDPYQIWTPEQMNAIGATPTDWDRHFKLMDDIDMSAYTGTQYKVIGTLATPFTGAFDGNGQVIRNLTYIGTGYNIGLFGCVGIGGQIANLRVENVTISISSSGNAVGGLVGRNYGLLTGCYANGTVSGSDEVGGLAARLMSEASLIDCHADVTVSGYWRIGGLVGLNQGALIGCSASGATSGVPHASSIGGLAGANYGGTVNNCYATGMVSGESYVSGLGGLIGDNSNGIVTGCYATGAVSGMSGGVGGLMGSSSSYSTVTSCYATGSVSGDYSVGGLMGDSHDGSITHCYATGLVRGNTNFGGLFGLFGGKLNGCFWNTQTSGTTDGVGGSSPDPTGATGKTTAQMKTLSTFTNAGWDFVGESANGTAEIWRMCVDDVDYPRLYSEFIDGDFTCPDGVNLLDFSILARAWQSTPTDDNWDDTCDLDGDEHVGAGDLAIACGHWLEER